VFSARAATARVGNLKASFRNDLSIKAHDGGRRGLLLAPRFRRRVPGHSHDASAFGLGNGLKQIYQAASEINVSLFGFDQLNMLSRVSAAAKIGGWRRLSYPLFKYEVA
jgi:hypothetical protein